MSNKSRLLSFASLSAMLGKGFSADAPADEKPADPPVDDKPADPPVDKPADPPVDDKPGEDVDDEPGATVDTVLAADAVRLAGEARAAGFAEANARMKAVLESKEGKANLQAAGFLLCNSTASADACIAHLATLPAQTTIATTTPKVDLTGGKPAEIAASAEKAGEDGATDATKLWASVQNQHNAMTRGGNGINLAV